MIESWVVNEDVNGEWLQAGYRKASTSAVIYDHGDPFRSLICARHIALSHSTSSMRTV